MLSGQSCPLLRCPAEIRLRIYEVLFSANVVLVQVAQLARTSSTTLTMNVVPMSAQILRTCKQVYDEARIQLYSNRIFDCSQREGIKLLLQNVKSENFSLIKHVKTDWDELQSLSWALAKDEYQFATQGIVRLELASWRIKISEQSAFLWGQVKGQERQLYQSAFDICQKHRNLKLVVERTRKLGRANKHANNTRVIWRFIASLDDCLDGEDVLPVEPTLARLQESSVDDRGRQPNLTIDIF